MSRSVILIPGTRDADCILVSDEMPRTLKKAKPQAKSDLCKGVTLGRGRR